MQMGELYCHMCSFTLAGPHRNPVSVYTDLWFRGHSGTVVEIQHDVRHSLSPGPVLPVVECVFRTETLRSLHCCGYIL